MNHSRATKLIAAAGALMGLASYSFCADGDAMVGDWKLNVAKSTFDAGPSLKQMEIKVSDAGGGKLFYSADWVEGDGTKGHDEFTAASDGKPAAVKGYPEADSVTVRKVNATTTKVVFTKSGKVVERETMTLSADGKTLNDLDTGTDLDGHPYKDHLLLERQ